MNERGNILLSLSFFILISLIGVGLMNSNKLHFRLNRVRNDKFFKKIEFRNQIFQFMENMKMNLFDYNISDYNEIYELINYIVLGEDILLENNIDYKTAEFITEKNKIFRKKIGFYLKNDEDYLRIFIKLIIDSVYGNSSINNFGIILNDSSDEKDSEFIKKMGINYDLSTKVKRFKPKDFYFNFQDFLINKMKILTNNINWELIREKLGLEKIEEPIEPGVYFSYNNNYLDFIFIQGNLDRLILSADDEYQYITLIRGSETFEIKYKPNQSYLNISDEFMETIFKEVIIVNGDLLSLEQINDYGLNENSNLTISVSGRLIIRSSIISKGIKLKKRNFNNLNLIVSNRFFDYDIKDSSGIFISDNVKQMDLSMITNKKIENNSKNLLVNGSLFADELSNKGSINMNYYKSSNDFSKWFYVSSEGEAFRFFIYVLEEVYYE